MLAALKLFRAVVYEDQRWVTQAHAQIVAAGYTSLEAETLAGEVLERLAGSQLTDTGTT
jgi:hypothetical protein